VTSSASAETPDRGAGGSPSPGRVVGALRAAGRSGKLLEWVGGIGAVLPALALVFIFVTLLLEAFPVLGFNGWHFFSASGWKPGNLYSSYGTGGTGQGGVVSHPPGASYGAWPLIFGTLVSSAIALVIAVPVSIGAALVIVERLPRQIAYAVGMFLELLAGIPSVILGLWGVITFGPFLSKYIYPWVSSIMPNFPPFSYFGGATGNGEGMISSSLVLAVMVIPIVAATTRDLIRQVPLLPREGAVALGMSDMEAARRVTLPWVGGGIVGAVVLGLGRALGETVAVAMISGAALGSVPNNIYDTFTTIAATIVNTLDSALTDATDFAVKTLAELSLVLMVITLLTNILARFMVRRVSGTALPVGRGV
jgi:phosphate transport system permease protein